MLRPIKILIETNLYIAIIAVAFMWANIYLLGLQDKHLLILSLQIFFSTWFVYQISRWVYFKKGFYTNSEELVLKWFQKNPGFSKIMIYTSGIIAVALTLFLKWKTILVLCFIGTISVSYPLPIFKLFGNDTRLRDFPFVKLFLIGIVWSVTSVILPATEAGISFHIRKDIYLLLLTQFIFILFITLPFDINDAIVDKKANMKTIPAVFGIKTSKIICLCLGILYAIAILYVFMIENWRTINSPYLTESTIILIWIMLVLLQAFTFFKSDKTTKWWIKIVYDGSMLLYFFIVFFTKK